MGVNFPHIKYVVLDQDEHCCNQCFAKCTCEGQGQSKTYNFEKVTNSDESVDEEDPTAREVRDEDRQCLKEALQEVQLSLGLSSGVTLFE